MSGGERFEHWRNQTLVNRVNTDSDLLIEYHSLIVFIEKEYKERFECIQSPLLHLISHCIELLYKCVIKQGIDQRFIEVDYSKICHTHSLAKLLPYILKIFKYMAKNYPPGYEKYFKTDFVKSHNDIVKSLKSNVTTYRYALRQDNKGEINGMGHPFVEDYESPNMIDLFKLFHTCYDSLSYTSYIFHNFYSNDD